VYIFILIISVPFGYFLWKPKHKLNPKIVQWSEMIRMLNGHVCGYHSKSNDKSTALFAADCKLAKRSGANYWHSVQKCAYLYAQICPFLPTSKCTFKHVDMLFLCRHTAPNKFLPVFKTFSSILCGTLVLDQNLSIILNVFCYFLWKVCWSP
jgi:hypothetical protein